MPTRKDMLNAIGQLVEQCYSVPMPEEPIKNMLNLLREYDEMTYPPLIDDDLLNSAYEFCINTHDSNRYADLMERFGEYMVSE